jgi:hypothetical protein
MSATPRLAPHSSSIATQFSRLFERDSSESVERRVKVLTEGKDDTADPCTPVKMTLPDGEEIWGLYFSGGRVIYGKSLDDLLRGGVRPFEQIEVQSRNGKPLMMEPFHQAEAIWDTELVVYDRRNRDGTIERAWVGHGGKMDRIAPDEPCNVHHHNYRRSRHAFQVEFSRHPESGKIREVWKSLGSIHGHRPPNDGRWISRDEDQMHAHGYGSRMIRDASGTPWRDEQGVMWMAYEEVTEEKVLPDGRRLPFATEIFARRLNEDLSLSVGAPVRLSSFAPWQDSQRPFKASRRQDPQGQPAGFLVEGPNPILLTVGDREYWVIFFSAGDFVAEYGNFMMYREKEEGPIGPYKHVVDFPNSDSAELLNVTESLVETLGLTWAGRLNPFYDDKGQLWGLMHGIFKAEIPDGWVKSGWPRRPEEFICYARRVFLVPLKVAMEKGQPIVKVDDPNLSSLV